MASIRVVGVVGAGQMGSGIAQVVAAAKMQVIMADVDDAALGRGLRSVSSSLSRFVKKQLLSQEDADATMSRLRTTTSLQEMQDADVVIEAVAENEGLKTRIFGELDKLLKPSAILASNTSSISITRLAASTQRPKQVIGMHFMNPPPLMKLVEIVRGMATEDEVFDKIKSLAERCGKVVSSAKDYLGFIVNRLLMPQINEAFYCLQEGVSTPIDIDMAMKLGTNQPMGPLALADLIGLDTCLSIMPLPPPCSICRCWLARLQEWPWCFLLLQFVTLLPLSFSFDLCNILYFYLKWEPTRIFLRVIHFRYEDNVES